MLFRSAECNVFDPARVLPFTVAGTRVGWVRRELAPRLQAFADALDVSAAEIALRPYLTTFTERGTTVPVSSGLRPRSGPSAVCGAERPSSQLGVRWAGVG